MPHGLGPVETGAFQLENLLLVFSSRWYQWTLFLWGPLLLDAGNQSFLFISSLLVYNLLTSIMNRERFLNKASEYEEK